jgi:sulfate-transporting ATPase
MEDILKFALLGLGTGALYALAAQGMVIIYRGSGVINFSHGAMALLSAAVFAQLRMDMQLPLYIALPIAIGCSALFGFLLDFLIMQRIRSASPLSRLIVTLGALGMIESIVIASYGSGLRFVDQFLPDNAVSIAGISISSDRLWLLAISLVITLALWAIYRFTEFGRQTTAVAENSRTAAAVGISPNAVSQINWTLGSALAGLTGILLVPVTGLMASTMVLLINPILATALVGRFASFPLTLMGGLLIGIAQSWINLADIGGGWSSAVPFLVIIALLIVRGQSLPMRGFIADRLPSVGAAMAPGKKSFIALIIAALLITIVSEDYLAAMTATMLSAVILLSIVVLTGLAGQVSLGQYAFAGVGAFVAARIADVYGLHFIVCFTVAIIVAVAFGLLFALPALRTRGINLAIATFGLGVSLDELVFKNKDLTGGFIGTQVTPPSLFGFSFDYIEHPQRYAFLVLALLAVCALVVSNLRRSAGGRRLLATRSNERAATAVGISVVGAKLYAFAVAAAIAAAGGVLTAFRYPNVRFDAGYSSFDSIPAILMSFLGGVGFIAGAVVGGLMSLGGVVNETISSVIELNEWMGFAVGVGAITMVMTNPDGLAALFYRRRKPATQIGSNAYSLSKISRCPAKNLEISNLSVHFGGVVALNDVSFSVEPGQVVGLIGPNGAGKTTLIDAISGFTKVTNGTLRICNDDISALTPTERARLGASRSFQSLELFDDLSVEEHLRCASEQTHKAALISDLFRPSEKPLSSVALQTIEIFKLQPVLHCLPKELSYGQRRLLGIARAVATQPSVLLLDEPAAGLTSAETRELGQLIEVLAKDWGIAVLLIEHDMNLVMNHCDALVVLDFGNKLASGTPEEVSQNPAVINAYLGTRSAEKNTL